MQSSKFQQQSAQYSFPYHYIPNTEAHGSPVPYRWYPKATEYLCYQRYIQECVAQYADRTILDVGCGDGRFCYDLPQLRKRDYVGVDFDERAIHFARGFNPGVRFVAGDARDVAGTFGIVVAIEVLEHIPDDEVPAFLETAQNKLSGGGVVILCVPSVNKEVSEKHYRHYTLESLSDSVLKHAPELEFVRGEYVFQNDLVLAAWEKFTRNSVFRVDIPMIRPLIWRHCFNRCMRANERNGLHVAAIFRRR